MILFSTSPIQWPANCQCKKSHCHNYEKQKLIFMAGEELKNDYSKIVPDLHVFVELNYDCSAVHCSPFSFDERAFFKVVINWFLSFFFINLIIINFRFRSMKFIVPDELTPRSTLISKYFCRYCCVHLKICFALNQLIPHFPLQKKINLWKRRRKKNC